MKRLIYILLALLGCMHVAAQTEGWYKYPVFADTIDDVVETSDKVYYLSGGNLFSYSPEDEESYYYSSSNKLSDVDIESIHYNFDKKYLLVIYNNCNIDVLFDNGKVVNLPDIKDSQLSSTKKVNDVAFGSNRIALATSFGLVVFDDDRMEVKESGIYNIPIYSVSILADKLLVHYRKDDGGRYIFYSPLEGRHNTLDKFTQIGWGAYTSSIVPLSDSVVLLRNPDSGQIVLRKLDFSNNSISNLLNSDIKSTNPIRRYKDGWYTWCDDGLILINEENIQLVEMPETLKGQKFAIYDTPDKVWAGNGEGVMRCDVSGSTPTVLNDRMVYRDAITCEKVGYMRWSPDNKRLYISNMVVSNYRSIAIGECADAYQTTNVIEDGFPRDVSLKVASADHSQSIKHQTANHNTRMYGDPAWIVEDPDNPDIYYCANNHEGLYVIKYNEQTGEYDEIGKFKVGNSPIIDNWGARVQDVNIDPQGNLWVGYQKGSYYSVLPADKRRQDPATITASDWREVAKLKNFEINQIDMMSVICRRSNMVFVFTGKYEGGIVAIDTKGTYDNPNDDVAYHWSSFTDQDGNVFAAPNRITFALEDNRGAVWIGSSTGVFEIPNPANATNPNMTVRRIKVPRNDGTNYADYLLESDIINWMCLDPSGRKWIATENSGIFLVSETGDEIIRNYNVENSPLPSNSVASIECDPNNNTVYVGTAYGLYSFLSDSTPPQESYDNIYAYPNPVRPEFTGDVKITGLMDNSVVKIADAAGNVVYQTRSEGGMASWNVCNASGNRVKSGVYYVYASSNNGSAAGAVTKILVIN